MPKIGEGTPVPTGRLALSASVSRREQLEALEAIMAAPIVLRDSASAPNQPQAPVAGTYAPLFSLCCLLQLLAI